MTTTAPKKTSLFELSAAFLELDQLLTDSGGDWTLEIEQRFAALEEGEEAKADGYGWILKGIGAELAGLKLIRDDLAEKIGTLERKEASLKRRVLDYLTVRKLEKLKGTVWTLAKTANGGADPVELLVKDPAAFPERLVKREPAIDMAALRAELAAARLAADAAALERKRLAEAGEPVPPAPELPADHVSRFATFTPRGHHVRVR